MKVVVLIFLLVQYCRSENALDLAEKLSKLRKWNDKQNYRNSNWNGSGYGGKRKVKKVNGNSSRWKQTIWHKD